MTDLSPPEPSQPTPPITVDKSNGGELVNPEDTAYDYGPLGYGTEEDTA